LDQRKVEVAQASAVVDAVVKGDRGGEADELNFIFVPGLDGGGGFADVEGEFMDSKCLRAEDSPVSVLAPSERHVCSRSARKQTSPAAGSAI
jgi:hypothetical protein